MIPFDWVWQASQRLIGRVARMPTTHDERLKAYFKWENHQITGSFKIRGAYNRMLTLQDWERKKGVITASAGNHGQGVALAAEQVGTECIVFVPEHAAVVKVEAMKKLGAQVTLVHGGYAEAEKTAIKFALACGKTFISPYNDAQVIAGQGTIGFELMELFPDLVGIENILVPAGGGSLLSGIGITLSRLSTRPKLIGIQSEASPFLHRLFHQGNQDGIIETETIAEGLAGEVEQDAVTIPIINKLVDDIILVTEVEIRDAIRYSWKEYHERIEGSAAVGLAAILNGKVQGRPTITIITGGNIDSDLFDEIINDDTDG